jgi:hypothetical protein
MGHKKITSKLEKESSLLCPSCSACWRHAAIFLMHFLDYVSIETEYLITHVSAFQKTFLILDLGEFSSCMGGHNVLLNAIKHKRQTCFVTLQHTSQNSFFTFPIILPSITLFYAFTTWSCDDDDDNNSIKFNSILIYLRANLTAQRPITKLAWVRSKKQQQYIYK